jgi:hypothetical protein
MHSQQCCTILFLFKGSDDDSVWAYFAHPAAQQKEFDSTGHLRSSVGVMPQDPY